MVKLIYEDYVAYLDIMFDEDDPTDGDQVIISLSSTGVGDYFCEQREKVQYDVALIIEVNQYDELTM